MKRFIAMIIMLLPFSAMASLPELNELANKYSSVDDVTVVNLTGEMFSMVGVSSEIDLSAINDIVVIQTESAKYAKDISKRFNKIAKSSEFASLANIDNEGAKVRMYQKTTGELIDFIVFVSEGDKIVILDICGKFNEESIATILDAIGNI
ncbi:MAG: DUF4252 domain-containing protein [Alistipes sp.]|nr:DUF4252 domain-containing protein [Alistipes sp.]